MEHWDSIVTDSALRLQNVQAFVTSLQSHRRYMGEYYVAATSGSTGRKGVFVYNEQEWMTILASYARANDWAGVEAGLTKRLKVAVVSSRTPSHQSAVVGSSLRSWLVPTLRLESTEPIETIVAQLNQFQPRSLVGYASMIRMLAQEQHEGRLQIYPEALFCASEVLTEEAREIIYRAWQIQPFNVYAATETAGIASETIAHDGLKMYEDLVCIESVNEKNLTVPAGEFGAKVLATVLFTRTLPLIRYEITDSIAISDRLSSTGFPSRMVDGVQGRTEEILSFTGRFGELIKIQPHVFHPIMKRIESGGWQILQQQDSSLLLRLVQVPSPFHADTVIAELHAVLTEHGVEHPTVQIEHAEFLQRGALGKTLLIQAWKGV